MKIYISGPITGTTDYLERFAKEERKLKEKGHEVINPAAVNAMLPESTSYEEYMKMSLTMLDMCGAIYMMEGWEKSCGSNREYGYAMASGKVIVECGLEPIAEVAIKMNNIIRDAMAQVFKGL